VLFSKNQIFYDIFRWLIQNSLWLKKKVKMPKVAQKPLESIVIKYLLQNTALKKKLVLAARSVININVTFSNFKDFIWIFHAEPKNCGFYFSSYHYSQPYEENSWQYQIFLELYFAADILKQYFLKAFEQLLGFLLFFSITENF
jgi:hypothetical protein